MENSIEILLCSCNETLVAFTKRDLLGEKVTNPSSEVAAVFSR